MPADSYLFSTKNDPNYQSVAAKLKNEIEIWNISEGPSGFMKKSDLEFIVEGAKNHLSSEEFSYDIFLLLDKNETIQGFAFCDPMVDDPDNRGYYISHLCVAPWNLFDAHISKDRPRPRFGSMLLNLIASKALAEKYKYISATPHFNPGSRVSEFYKKLGFSNSPSKSNAIHGKLFLGSDNYQKLLANTENIMENIQQKPNKNWWAGTLVSAPWFFHDAIDNTRSPISWFYHAEIKDERSSILFKELCKYLNCKLHSDEINYLDQALQQPSESMTQLIKNFEIYWCYDKTKNELTDKVSNDINRIPYAIYYFKMRRKLCDDIFAYLIFLNLRIRAQPCELKINNLIIEKVFSAIDPLWKLPADSLKTEQIPVLWFRACASLLLLLNWRKYFEKENISDLLKSIENYKSNPDFDSMSLDEKGNLAFILKGFSAILFAIGKEAEAKLAEKQFKDIEAFVKENEKRCPINIFIEAYRSNISIFNQICIESPQDNSNVDKRARRKFFS